MNDPASLASDAAAALAPRGPGPHPPLSWGRFSRQAYEGLAQIRVAWKRGDRAAAVRGGGVWGWGGSSE